ncbi:MAG: sugar ABC transporter permease [Chloroflexi bacterium]|nr:MAG: sugar ABC transporter permease [Chloroflexota bacterium]
MNTAVNQLARLGQQNQSPQRPTRLIIAGVVLNIAVIIGALVLALYIIGLKVEEFGNLGRPVQYFVGGLLLIPALAGTWGSIMLWRTRPSGRYITLALQFLVTILSGVALLHLWGVFLGFEALTDSIIQNGNLLPLVAIAYAIFWLSGKLPETVTIRKWGQRVGLLLGAIAALWLLVISNLPGILKAILDSYGNPMTWIVSLLLVVAGFTTWQLLQHGAAFGETTDARVAWQGWLMLSPNIIGFLIFFAGPLLLSFYLSFTDSSVGQVPNVIGFENYQNLLALEFKVLEDPSANAQSVLSFGYNVLFTMDLGGRTLVAGAKDTLFWLSLRNTLLFCLLLVPLSTIPAIGLAMILNAKIPGVKFFRAVYFLPSVAAVVGTALIWRWLYDPTIGYFNYIISQVVNFLNQTFGMSLTDPNIQWLTGPGVVLLSIVFLAAWQVVGFNTVLFLAGLQGIPGVLYEAAIVDGANRLQRFWHVTLPLLAPTTFFVVITTVITGLQVFNEPYALFPSRPIPVNATTSVFYLYNQGFFRFEFGYASAIAWFLFFLIFSVTLIQFRISRSAAYDA